MIQCPHCGSSQLGYRPMAFASVTMFRCLACGYAWAQYGASDPRRVRWRRALAVFWQGLRIYVRIAVVTWGIAGVVLLLVVLREPGTAATQLGARWFYIGLGLLLGGAVLGMGLNLVLLIAGFLRNRGMHIVLPLLWSGFVGGSQAAILSPTVSWLIGTASAVRSAALVIPVGILLGFAVTPIVIVRAAKACRRRGLRLPPEGSEGDRRWDCSTG